MDKPDTSTKATITAPSGKDIKSRTPPDYGISRREAPVHVLTSRSSATKWENNYYYITYICKTIKYWASAKATEPDAVAKGL